MTHDAQSALAAAQMRSALLRLSTRIAESRDETDLCGSVVDSLNDAAFGFAGVALYLTGGDTFQPVLAASAGNFAHSADAAELKRPLRIGESPIGELVVQRESGRAFERGDVEILSAAASQASIALGRVRLLAAERTRTTEQRALLDTLTDLSSELQLDRLLQAVLERAVGLLGVTAGELAIYEEEADELVVVASYNMEVNAVGTRMRVGEGAMGHVAETHEPLIIPRYQDWEGRSDKYTQSMVQSVMATPLLIGSRLVGAIASCGLVCPGLVCRGLVCRGLVCRGLVCRGLVGRLACGLRRVLRWGQRMRRRDIGFHFLGLRDVLDIVTVVAIAWRNRIARRLFDVARLVAQVPGGIDRIADGLAHVQRLSGINYLAGIFQIGFADHVIDARLEFPRKAARLPRPMRGSSHNLRQIFRSNDEERDQRNHRHLGPSDVKHAGASLLGGLAARFAAGSDQPLAALSFSSTRAEVVDSFSMGLLGSASAVPVPLPFLSSSLRPFLKALMPWPMSRMSFGILPPPPNRTSTTAKTMSQCQMLKVPIPAPS